MQKIEIMKNYQTCKAKLKKKYNKRVSGNESEILGRVGTHTIFFLNNFFFGKNIILCILKGILPFKMHKVIFFPENMKTILGFTSKLR